MSCLFNEAAFGPHLRTHLLLAMRINRVSRRLELSIPMPKTSEDRVGQEVESIVNGQRFNQSYLWNEASAKTQKDLVWRASHLANVWRSEESSMCRESRGAPHTVPRACPWHLFHLDIPELSFYNEQII